MTKITPILLLWAVFGGLPGLHAQIEDLTQDASFFRSQIKVYQRWLDHSGLGQHLSVYDVKVEADLLSLYLKFPYADTDSVLTAWDQLKAGFESASALSLEEQLFHKAGFIMEVSLSMLSVQLYDTYDTRLEPLFVRIIYFADGTIKVDASNPRDKREIVELAPADLGNNKEISVVDFRNHFSRRQVYDCILQYARQRYGQSRCIERYPEVRLLEDGKNLVFEVSDLCREVLTDEANPTLCGLLSQIGYDCNWVKRELLRFTITYEETTDGFRLIVLTDGKYGSGFYDRVKRGGYIDMEVDFDEYLEDYAKLFSTELRRVLLNCR